MYATNVRNLKRNPSEALRHAELEPALAASLFKDRVMSLGAAAKISGLSLSEFIDHLAQLDIDLLIPDQQTSKELGVLASWLS